MERFAPVAKGTSVRAVCEYDRGRGLEGDEGAGRTRGACTEALAGFLFLRGLCAVAQKA